jgi:HEAT repeat protein
MKSQLFAATILLLACQFAHAILAGEPAQNNIMRKEAAKALCSLKGSGGSSVRATGAGISSVFKINSNRAASDRAATALLLGRKSDPPTIAALRRALADKHAAVRAAAVAAIALGNDPARVPEAESMLSDKNPIVRVCAAACYLRLRSIATSTAGHS